MYYLTLPEVGRPTRVSPAKIKASAGRIPSRGSGRAPLRVSRCPRSSPAPHTAPACSADR